MFKLQDQLSPDAFINTFFEVNKTDHQRPSHPWDSLFRAGKCTREQLQGWAKERYYFTRQVPIKEYSILYNCPHTDVRRMWLPKAIEEEGEDLIGKPGKPHPEYWLDVCEGLGMNREFVKNSEPLFGVKFAVDSFANAAFGTSWLLGVAVSEGDDTARAMTRDLDVFRTHYKWVPDDALELCRGRRRTRRHQKRDSAQIRHDERAAGRLHQRAAHEEQHAPGHGGLHLHDLRGPRHELGDLQRRRVTGW